MLLLVTHAQTTMQRYSHHPSLGRLVQPRHYSSVAATAASGLPWAADNDAFGTFDAGRYLKMCRAIKGLPGCLFVTVPDVVGDADATLALWRYWYPRLVRYGQPLALVLQDGMTPLRIPSNCGAVFVGGTTAWKLGAEARLCVRTARARGLWVHMGRVNSEQRIRYAASIGCQSVDGTGWARFVDVHLARGLRAAENAGSQLLLGTEA